MRITLLVVLVVVVLGLHFMMTPKAGCEGFCPGGRQSAPPYRCPNVLIQNGAELELHNTRLAKVPGVNPIHFENLEQYVEFTRWQRSQGIRCPVLFLQHSFDAQGQPVYKARPSPTDLRGGAPDLFPMKPQGVSSQGPQHAEPDSKLLDASRDDPPYNTHSYPGYDPQDQYIGLDTPLDRMFHGENGKPSPSAMDTTWAGSAYAQKLVDAGYYDGDKVGAYPSAGD